MTLRHGKIPIATVIDPLHSLSEGHTGHVPDMTAPHDEHHPGTTAAPATLAEILAPFDERRFLDEKWLQEPVAVTGTPGRFRSLLTRGDIDRLLRENGPDEIEVRVMREGETTPAGRYSAVPPGPRGYYRRRMFDPEAVRQAAADGGAVMINFAERRIPALAELAYGLELAFGAETVAHAVATSTGGPALDVHCDVPEVLVLQIEGRRRWRVFPPGRPDPLKGGPVKLRRGMRPQWEGELEPGDLLYLPCGWPHCAGGSGPSLHVSMAVTAPPRVQVLQWFMERAKGHAAFRRRLPVWAGPDAVAAEIRRLATDIRTELEGADVRDYLDWRDQGGRPHPGRCLADGAGGANPDGRLTPESVLRLRIPRRPLVRERPEVRQLEVRAGGLRHLYDPRIAPMIERIATGRRLTARELAATVSATMAAEDALDALGRLLADGFVVEL